MATDFTLTNKVAYQTSVWWPVLPWLHRSTSTLCVKVRKAVFLVPQVGAHHCKLSGTKTRGMNSHCVFWRHHGGQAKERKERNPHWHSSTIMQFPVRFLFSTIYLPGGGVAPQQARPIPIWNNCSLSITMLLGNDIAGGKVVTSLEVRDTVSRINLGSDDGGIPDEFPSWVCMRNTVDALRRTMTAKLAS